MSHPSKLSDSTQGLSSQPFGGRAGIWATLGLGSGTEVGQSGEAGPDGERLGLEKQPCMVTCLKQREVSRTVALSYWIHDSSAPRTEHLPRNLRRISTSPGTRHTVLSSMGTTSGGCSFTSCTLQETAQLHAWGQQLGPTQTLPGCPGSYLHRASLMSCRREEGYTHYQGL